MSQELRLDKYPLNILIVDDIKPYKARKVAILNGAHTALVPVAYRLALIPLATRCTMPEFAPLLKKAIYEEIIPVLDLPREALESFASAVTGRFRNPYIKHQLLSIALNGMTKFRTRILPQLLEGQQANGQLPARLTFALAALIAFIAASGLANPIPFRMMHSGLNVTRSYGGNIATRRSTPRR